MIIEIPTSPEVAQHIRDLFKDKVLKPKNMTLMSCKLLTVNTEVVKIDWLHGELSELFFLGYWTKHLQSDLTIKH